jgi:hypothetical protein
LSAAKWAGAVAPAAALVLVAAALTAACDRASAPPTVTPSAARSGAPSVPAPLRDPVALRAADALCSAENEQEMGTARLGRLYGAHSSGYLAVQKLESQARRELRAALAKLPVKDADSATLGRLLAAQDAVLDARETLLGVVAKQPQQNRLAPLTGPHDLVGAYRRMVDAYLTAGRDFLAAGLPSCATPLITVLYGPGGAEASGATVEFRIAAACPTVSYVTEGTDATLTATLGSVMQPGTHKQGDRYDNSSGPVDPAVRPYEVVVLTSNHYPVKSAACAGSGAEASASGSLPASGSPPSTGSAPAR